MTKKYNLAVTERQMAILKTALGEFGMARMREIEAGHTVFIDDQRVHPQEFLDVIEAIKLAETGTPPETEILDNVEKFVISAAIGALTSEITRGRDGDPRRIEFILRVAEDLTKKLRLHPGSITGRNMIFRAFE